MKDPTHISEKASWVSEHYNDWPNTLGFTSTYEQRSPVELEVIGIVPEYAAGVLFRTGVGPRTVTKDGRCVFRSDHWFDNFAQVHRFEIRKSEKPGGKIRVFYSSRLTSDGLIEKVRRTGQIDSITFAARYEPCRTLFQKVQSYFKPFRELLPKPLPKPNEVNIGVTMSINHPGISHAGLPSSKARDFASITSLCTKTDASVVQMLDSETLEPIGLARQSVLHPDLTGPLSAAHAKSDPETGDVYNFNLQLGGRQGTYRVFRTSASTGKTDILATLNHNPAYLHSLFLTEHYVVLCVWNTYFTMGGASVIWYQNIVSSLRFEQQQPAKWFVIDRRPPSEGGLGILATFESPPFFSFHAVNAYEYTTDQGKTNIIADLPVYQDFEVVKAFYLDNLLSSSPTAQNIPAAWRDSLKPKYRRYLLCDIPSEPRSETRKALIDFELDQSLSFELPTLNSKVSTQRHRYVYGVYNSGKSTLADSLVKLDLSDKLVKRWTKHGNTAGEAIFVADPSSDEEDGGVLLSVVLDGIAGKSYLLVLDARDMTEMGRVHVDGAIGFGFHGLHTKLPAGGYGVQDY